MSKKQTIDNAGRIADILASHPNISAEMEEYHKGEGMEFLERAKNIEDIPQINSEVSVKILELLEEVADTSGLFVKIYIALHQTRIMERILFGAALDLLNLGKVEDAKNLLKNLTIDLYEDNNEDNGH